MNLEDKIIELFSIIDGLNKKVASLEKVVNTLKDENQYLKTKLHKKDSKNSSIAPSKDENRIKPNQTLRKKTGKKNGGQKGHPGSYLKMVSTPDAIVDHKSDYCCCCGKKLGNVYELVSTRQVIDLPPILATVKEHRQYKVQCNCGQMNKPEFPKEASSPVSYGTRVEAMIGYMSTRQYMSISRISEFFDQVFGMNISEGTVVNKLKSLATKCIPIYETIRERVSTSQVIGSDETGCVVNGKKHWMWTWQNENLTFITANTSRGYQAIQDNFPDGFVDAVLVSDCWAAQLKTPARKHQICLAHLLRDLQYFIELGKEKWSKKVQELIFRSLKLKEKILENLDKSYQKEIEEIIAVFTVLIHKNIEAPKKLLAFQKRLKKNSDAIWTFLYNPIVPPDNNGSERAIRNVKVKQKISGQFVTIHGAIQFAIIRSIIDTAIKNDAKVFHVLDNIAILVPE